ncbi:hypothetical protein [Cupriavidus taiwanensis]|uniref:Uncharacterized protein n=1 Tax=Cupriavidus taiwanensis TaxID=164546 RepID=A0A375CQ49_9BURK|nr:hypothetical protein [Cupriavidus taiwanensis]SOY74032.1 hypothetical protein CBM2588_P100015 [Cupriavidus taiwanensis]SOY74122.1 hypothetical protein CBM2592_P120013 [Cupriavidus taiwanensis]SOY77390.1 hypothetical protein CBM2589_P90013 [Cupriavidus taiwanensis]SOY98939.1 hypothetical protein CBM2591_P120013 [Cupriavidus taiwanensis]SOZ21260.1 hypothetical protein CBM2595_P90014 [Cupriavidus taiwanensis]
MNDKSINQTARDYRRDLVTGSWLPDDVAVGAYWNGAMWNGFPVPVFTSEDGDALCAVMPKLVYVAGRRAFLFDENDHVEWFHAAVHVVEGKEQPLYAIGNGWCWQFAGSGTDAIELSGSYLVLQVRPQVGAWIENLAQQNGQALEHYADFLLGSFCEDRRDGRPRFDLSCFEATVSRAKLATPITQGQAVRVRGGAWLGVVDAVLALAAAEDGGAQSRLSRERFAETVLDSLARELGGVK